MLGLVQAITGTTTSGDRSAYHLGVYNSDGAEFDACSDTLGLQLAKTEKNRTMPVERQKNCPNCGPVLAREIEAMTQGEKLLLAAVTLFTCFVGAIFTLPYAFYRGMKAAGFHCPKCGEQILGVGRSERSERKRAKAAVERVVAEMESEAAVEAAQPVEQAAPAREVLCCPTCGHTLKTGKTLGLPGSQVVTCKACSNTFTLEQGRV